MVKEKSVGKKKTANKKILAAVLALSLCVNAGLAVRCIFVSGQADRTKEELAAREQELSRLRQEKESQETTEITEQGDTMGESEKDAAQEAAETETEGLTEAGTEGVSESETEHVTVSEGGPVTRIRSSWLDQREQNGEVWAVSIEPLNGKDQVFEYNGSRKMQSASVIKVFIMGAVYDRICYPSSPERSITVNESYEGELRSLLEQMITVSDNDAANRLVELLGEGDFRKGAAVVNEFCQENGYTATSVGRRFLEENPTGDNYTSAADCRAILADIYQGNCVGEEASAKMLEILKGQTMKWKIPSALPEGVTSANKTGEMPEGYGLGCIENDMAIVFSDRGDYVLTVLSNELGGRNDEAQQTIQEISAYTWEWMDEHRNAKQTMTTERESTGTIEQQASEQATERETVSGNDVAIA